MWIKVRNIDGKRFPLSDAMWITLAGIVDKSLSYPPRWFCKKIIHTKRAFINELSTKKQASVNDLFAGFTHNCE